VNWILVPAAAAAAYQMVSLAASLKHLLSPQPPGGPLPPVSILKPVRGRDPHFLEAIRSHALLDYPEYEILFGFREADDPALEDIRRLMAEFPRRTIRLVRGGYDTANGKVGILMRLAEEARHAVLVGSMANKSIAEKRVVLAEEFGPQPGRKQPVTKA